MRNPVRYLTGWFLIAAVVSLYAAPEPVIYYDFEESPAPVDGGSVLNKSLVAIFDGTINGSNITYVAGAPDGFTPSGGLACDGLDSATLGGTIISTAYLPDDINLRGLAYTVSAWVNIDKASGDAMVLGQKIGGANWLHLGTRDAKAHSGHYGSDTTGPTVLSTGVWYHVAWQFDVNTQRVFVNGKLDGAAAVRVPIRLNDELKVGDCNGATRAFKGIMDEVAIYNEVLSPEQIAHLAAGGDPNVLPEGSPRMFFTGPYGAGGTWNLYEVVGTFTGPRLTWYDAYLASTNAEPVTGTAAMGHLLSVQSTEENQFAARLRNTEYPDYSTGPAIDVWTGLTDNDTNDVGLVFPGASESGKPVDVPDELTRRTNGWVWTSGEPYNHESFMQWNGGEPNDAPSEDAVEITGNGNWNDIGTGIPGSLDPENFNATIIEWDINSPTPVTSVDPQYTVRQLLPMMLPTLPGPEGDVGTFGGHWVQDFGAIGGLFDAMGILQDGVGTIYTTNANLPSINASHITGALQSGFIGNDLPYFPMTNAPTALHVVVYKGVINVTAAQAGQWTFGVRSDDGFALRIVGQNWEEAYGIGAIDLGDPTVLFYGFGTGNSNTRGLISLMEGQYNIEAVFYDSGGGNYHELFAAMGDWENEGDTDTWRPVGYVSGGSGDIPGMMEVAAGNSWNVIYSFPGVDGTINSTNTAWNAVTNYIGVTDVMYPEVNFLDPDSGQEGEILNSVAFPNDTPNTDDNDFACLFEGTLEIATAGTYYFGFRGDDGGWIDVDGQTWDAIIHDQTGVAKIEGSRLVADVPTGNSRTVGSMTLAAGSYTMTGLFFERGGGAYHDIFAVPAWAIGAMLPAGGGGAAALKTGAGETLADVEGLQLVTSGGTVILVLTGVTADLVGETVTLTWDSEAGKTYQIESCSDLNAMPQVWSLEKGMIAGQAGSTTDAISDDFSTPFVVLRVVEMTAAP